ncbi:immunoglobulin-like domain-containing protein [Paenibacillus allorhizosphaerae]|uniref:S-layer homology domain-containing protein n=1 Tax=Paenibacillus allorhizosphaerae TaxID=2849866 RepID=A0ABN7TLK8_9BACL|nr:immunoglobulin-like domain-containing protein [Paenibacillus allorhizosphaerae]CAG7636801.1 hypothetical protein PAECIP111802_02289 [Paenibacillus allorhizosphaerae]
MKLFQKSRRKISAILASSVLLSAMMPVLTHGASVELKDIADSYAGSEIQSLVDAGIISGYEDHTFGPHKAMTRAELAKMIVLTMGLKEDAAKASGFQDVDPSSWYSDYVGALVGSGITQGSSETTFSPDASITREELVVFFIRALGLENVAKTLPVDAELADLSEVSVWAKPHVSMAFNIGFVNGIQEAGGRLKFSPKAGAERQALARLAYEFKANKSKYTEKAQALAAKTENKPPKNDEPAVPGSATAVVGGGGEDNSGSGGNDENGTSTPTVSVAELLRSGTVLDSISINETGLYGPEDSASRTTITGTLTVDPGPDGTVTLQNIVMGPESDLEVLSGDIHSIKLQQTVIKQLRVNAVNNAGRDVRIEVKDGAEVESTQVQSQAVLESSSQTGKLGTITLSSGAASKTLTLKGNINSEVSVDAPDSKIELAPPSAGNPMNTKIQTLLVRANTTIFAGTGTSLSSVQVSGPNTTVGISGQGAVNSVNVDSTATGTTLNIGVGASIKSLRLDSPVVLKGDAEAITKLPASTGSGTVSIDDSVKADVKAAAIKTIVEAIDDIGEIKAYSEALENRINEVTAKVESARTLYDIKDTDISNLSVLDRARNEIILYKDLSLLEIEFASGDNDSSITKNIGLKKEGSASTAISWTSDKPAFIQNDGTVTRPAAGSPDEMVSLTATLSRHFQYTVTKTFVVTVKAERKPSGEKPDTDAPEQVTGLRVQETLENQVTLAWNAAKDNVATVGYSVYVNDMKYRDVSSENGIVLGLSPNTPYSFKVRAFDKAGNAGPFSAALVVSTKEASIAAPGSVTNLVYSARSTTMNLKWVAPANAMGTVSYAVYKDGAFLVNTSATNIDIIGLLPGTLYQFEVRAFNEAGYSVAAALSARTVPKLTVYSVRLYNSQTGKLSGNVPKLSDGRFLVLSSGIRDADALIVTFSDSTTGNSLSGTIDYQNAAVYRNADPVKVASGVYNDAVSGAVYYQFSLNDAKSSSSTQSSVTIYGLQYEISSAFYQVDPITVTMLGL